MDMDLSLLPILICSIFSIILSVYYLPFLIKSREDRKQSPKIPPGSTGLPLIGETLDFHSKGKKGMSERFVLDRMEKYSSTVIKTSLFGEQMAITCGPEAFKFIYSNENKLFKYWLPPAAGRLFDAPDENHFEEILSKRRKLYLSQFFSLSALQKYVPIIDSGAKQHLRTYWEGRDVVKAHPLAELCTITSTFRSFLGLEDTEAIANLNKHYDDLMKGLQSLPLNFPGTCYYRALKAKEKIKKNFDEWVKKWKTQYSEGKLSASQSKLADILHRNFQDDDISSILFTLIAASYESTSSAISSVIMTLAKFPHVYDKVLKEQRQIAKSKGGEVLDWRDIQQMKYSWNVACESLRLYSGDMIFKEVISDFTYDNFVIPKGWKMCWSHSATHKNPEYFKDPLKFDPSRFEGDGPMQHSFVPFGGGSHICPGREYARLVILVFMHNLVTKFKWEQIFPDEKVATTPTAKPAKGLSIRLYPHES